MGSTRLLAILAAIALAAGVLVPTAAAPAAADHQTYTGQSTSGLIGLDYAAVLSLTANVFRECATEARDNGGRDSGSWTTGEPYAADNVGTRNRDIVKTVADGDCTITYTVVQRRAPGAASWFDLTLTIDVTHVRSHAENEAEDTVIIYPDFASYEAAVDHLLRDGADIHICKAEIRRNSSLSTGPWSPWRTFSESIFSYRERSKTVADGRCEITYTYRELDYQPPWRPDRLTIRVVRTPPKTNSVSGSGRNYAATVADIAPRLARCAAEAAANASRSTGKWGYGNPYHDEDSRETRRAATKIVIDGRCEITYSVTDRFDMGAWRFVKVTITATEFVGNAPEPDDPPEGPGDKRDGCLPAVAAYFPHLCDTTVPDAQLTQCSAGAAAERPDLCDGATIVTEADPDPYEAEWREQERRKAENKKQHDAECAANPSEPCPPYPYEEWARQRSE